jgi:[glutamine synthetase] adenylyltransferase / [glutamine synthetase]-adenylyl-L-tyrosine phosphorylase
MSRKPLPSLLHEQWLLRREHFDHMVSSEQSQWLSDVLNKDIPDSNFSSDLMLVWSCSEFVASTCCGNPEMFQQLVGSGDLGVSYTPDSMMECLSSRLEKAKTEDDLLQQLRRFRNREMVRIVWRDFTRAATLEETTADMTRLAEACLQCALNFLYPQACDAWGTPVNSTGEPQKMVVLGMGKMGAWELNVSSDIDLIFAYPEAGETRDGRRSFSNQEFFIRLSQKLIKALDVRNADGFVFRMDMRLRPYGQSGALILSFDAMEEYYQTQGREWERYAMIKARVVAGDHQAGARLMALLRPFTYRKYIDFSAIESLRDMKALINREVQRKGISGDVKRGAGGIREVEFVAQAFQLIRGGRDVRFQTQALKEVLLLLGSEGLLPVDDVEALYHSYTFLRNVEHALQGWQDKQTQMLPVAELEQQQLAYVLGFDGWDGFEKCLEGHRAFVRKIFEDVIAEEHHDADSNGTGDDFQNALFIWQNCGDEDCTSGELEELGYSQPGQALGLIQSLRTSRPVLAMAADTRVRLDDLMPQLIAACAPLDNDAEALGRVLQLIESVARRSAYLVLLKENPMARQSTVKLCAASSWVAEQLSRYPALLDELLDSRTLYSLPDRDELEDELRQQLLRVPGDDLEAQMEVLRYFQRSHSLHVAACEVEDILPLVKVSDYLTWLAEAILNHVMEIAWDQMVARYGRPGGEGTSGDKPGFLILGYGKLGGIELGHSSDLDLVFLHDANPNIATDGERSIDNATFFMRLGQRIIHILTTQMSSGDLYEVDMRLRPSGVSGMLVSSLSGFEKYQLEDAWTWEHQALVRARPVAGSEKLSMAFKETRHRVLCQQREHIQLLNDVIEMRNKMRDHLGSGKVGREKLDSDKEGGRKTPEKSDVFNLKQDAGGIVDIEFMVQFAVLAWSHEIPDLTRWSDNIRILTCLEDSGVISVEDVEVLTSAYKNYRSVGHRLQLQKQPLVVKASEFMVEREQVASVWQQLLV